MILNGSSYDFCFLIENPLHICLGKYIDFDIYYPKMFSTNQNAGFCKV